MTVIASRLCVDSHRRRQRSTPVAEVELGSIELDVEPLFAEVDRGHLVRALDRVAPRHREVLELRERDGWSYQRIADHYDVTLGTVEALLHRARRALRREFLHVTGGEHGGLLAGVPGIAWALRRLGSLKTRAAGLAGHASPLSAAVASVALAAGSIAVVDARLGGGDEPLRPDPVVAVADGRASKVVPLPPAPAAASATAPAVDAPVPAPANASPDTPALALAPAKVHIVSADRARERSADAPLRQDVSGVGGLALDPGAVTADALDTLDPLPGRIP
jgi:hypothetical protein